MSFDSLRILLLLLPLMLLYLSLRAILKQLLLRSQ
jgi:hypothetical protein